MIEDIKETRLPNGLVVLTDRMEGVRSATLGFFYRTGSRHEPDELNGITHFIEHAVFKGTDRRSALEIAIEQDRLGGNLEAFTTHEETGFAIKAIDDQLPAAFDLLSDMLTSPQFDEKELEAERRVIIEELKMTDDSPEDRLGEIFSEAFFPGHPLGLNIAGTPDTVMSFNADVTRKYHEAKFHPRNLVIVAAGNVRHEHVLELAASLGTADVSAENFDPSVQSPTPAAPIVIHQKHDLEQAHLILATPFVGGADNRRYAADLLGNILGGGMSSRLWQKIREDRGLAYSVGASTIMFADCGYLSIFAGTSPEQAGEVVDISVCELRDLLRDGVTEDELTLAKRQAAASVLLSLEDSAARAASLAQNEILHGRQIPVEETLAKLDAVTRDDVAELAHEFFRTDNIAFAALGDLEGFVVERSRLAV